MGQFSDDGQWWWDGKQWIATSQVVIPDLGIPQPETLQKAMSDRSQLLGATNTGQAAQFVTGSDEIGTVLGLGLLFSERKAFRELRLWTLEQLAATAAHLLGPEEPMIAGETTLSRPIAAAGFFASTAVRRDFAIIVTGAHVLLLVIDGVGGQPRSIVLAARARDVRVDAPTPILSQPSIVVRRGPQTWCIQGTVGVIQPKPVVAAWRAAAAAPANP